MLYNFLLLTFSLSFCLLLRIVVYVLISCRLADCDRSRLADLPQYSARLLCAWPIVLFIARTE